MTTSQRCPYPWCAEEPPVSPGVPAATEHRGPAARVAVGDDRISVQVVADPDFGTFGQPVLIGLTATERSAPSKNRSVSLLLDTNDADALVDALTTARFAAGA